MSGLLDDRAGVSEGEEEPVSGEDVPTRRADRASGADELPENESGDEEEEEDEDEDEESADDSSEEEEGPDDYDYDDAFIAREDEDEDGDGAEAEPQAVRSAKAAKKKRRRRELVLEEEDYELLEENTGIRRARPAAHRRIKKARETGSRGGAGNMKELQAKLFGAELEGRRYLEDEDAGVAERARPAAREASAEAVLPEDEFDEDEDEDWIVDDLEAEGDEAAAAAAQQARRARRRALRQGVPDIDPDALEEANEIFGDVSDLLAMYEERKAALAAEDEDAEAAEDLFGGEEEEEGEEAGGAAAERRAAAARRVERRVDPSLLARHYLTATDEEIRETDLPERLQLADDPAPRSWSAAACADWVTARLLSEPGNAQRLLRGGAREVEGAPPRWVGARWMPTDLEGGLLDTADRRGLFLGRSGEGEGEGEGGLAPGQRGALRASVEAALVEMYERHREPETIGTQAKERVPELLVLRRSDEPFCTRADEADETYPAGAVQPRDRVVRRWEALHAVRELARRWRATQRLREARREAYERALAAAGDARAAGEVARCLELLEGAEDRDEVEDVDARFRQVEASLDLERLSGLSINADGNGETGGTDRSSIPSPNARPRKAGRAGAYATLARAGLAAAAPRFALPAAAVAGHLARGFVPGDALPPDPSESPLEFAQTYVAPELGFPDAERALRGIVRAAAVELAAEPAVRAHLRARFWDDARVSTFPTAAGEAGIEVTHAYALAKRLRGKPVASFGSSDLWLRVAAAEKEGLVRVTIDADAEILLEGLRGVYQTGRVAPNALTWDATRLEVLRGALRELGPLLEAGARRRLAERAGAALRQALADALWELATRPPHAFVVPGARAEEDEEVPEGERRVVAAVWGPGQPPTTLVALDAAGALVDWLHLAQWSGGGGRRRGPGGVPLAADPFQDPRRGKDAERVRAFLETHDPHALVVGTGHPDARGLHADLAGLLDSILAHAPGSRLASGLALVWGDERPAAAWETSAAAEEELPAAERVVRRAVALGRALLDPLAVLAGLAEGDGAATAAGAGARRRAVHAMPLHPLQGLLPLPQRDAAVDATLSAVVAQTGVDLNALAAAPWRAAPLAFVPGLGPRKARALLAALARRGGHVPHRAAIWRELRVLGDVVFRAAAPALRVRASHAALANAEMQQLDDTRIHPEHYALALEVARLAAGEPGRRARRDADASSDEDADAVALENAFARPRRVERLRLSCLLPKGGRGGSRRRGAAGGLAEDPDAPPPPPAIVGSPDGDEDDAPPPPPPPQEEEADQFSSDEDTAAHSSNNTKTFGMATLIDVQFEFARPYGELRPKSKRLEGADLFWLCVGETAETLCPGRKVEARVRYVSSAAAFVNLTDLGGIEGTIQSTQVSSSHGEVDCRDYLKPGDVVTARIVALDAATGQLELATTSRALNDDPYWEEQLLRAREPAYHPLTAQERAALERARRPAKPGFTPRQIRHPCFENVSLEAAAQKLLIPEIPLGTPLFRPSHKGTRHLILSIKLPQNVIWNLDIQEGPKPLMGTGQLQLGHPLSMEIIPSKPRVQYEELDEILSRFVEPVAKHLQALVRFRHWRAAGWEEAAEDLAGQKAGVPANQAVYCLGVEPTRPGMFFLGYVLGRTPHREFFMVTDRGFHFRKADFKSVEHMVNAFKKAPRGDAGRTAAARAAPPADVAPPAPPPLAAQYGSAQQQFSSMLAHGGGAYGGNAYGGAYGGAHGAPPPPPPPASAYGAAPPPPPPPPMHAQGPANYWR